MTPSSTIGLAEIRAAAGRIGPYVLATPMLDGEALGFGHLLLKAESLQRTGSFKPRGAFNAMLQLTPAQRHRGVITLSAGNHGQALAWAARTLGAPCMVVTPDTASASKVEAIRGFGALVVQTPATRLQQTLEEEQRARGLNLVHPFGDPAVISGQGTVGLEILEAVPEVATVIVPVGGGGLIAGIGAAIKSQKPEVRIIGIEPVGAAAVSESLQAGRPITLQRINTVADGLAAPYTMELNLRLVERFVDDIVCLSDDLFLEALRLVLLKTRLLVEPAGAGAVAGMLSGRIQSREGTTVAVLTGGNLDGGRLATWLKAGESPDQPGPGT